MPDWLLWGLLIVAAVAAGWAGNSWRHRTATRPTRRTGGTRSRPPRRSTPPRPRRRGGRSDAGERERDGQGPGERGRGAADQRDDQPRPGEIWWAEVPFADGTGAKDRPCLVLRADPAGADVLKITSQDRSDRDDHVPIPTRTWDPQAERDSFLDLAEPILVELAAFRSRAGRCDPQLWRRVRTLHRLPSR